MATKHIPEQRLRTVTVSIENAREVHWDEERQLVTIEIIGREMTQEEHAMLEKLFPNTERAIAKLLRKEALLSNVL
jgi:hypothetical protein